MATASLSQSTAQTVTLRCPAKVNLALAVGKPIRAGLHPIVSWMVVVGFGDDLALDRIGGEASTFDIAYADNAPRREAIDWPESRDLAVRAHRLLETRLGRPLPVRATLRKRVPTAAGLGGGSSDAAAMLVALNHLFALDLDDAALTEVSRTLGSDVGFLTLAIRGWSSAMVSGLGGVVEPMPMRETAPLVLILPPLRCPTPQVYQAFDQISDPTADLQSARVRQLAMVGRVVPTALFNQLAEAAMRVSPTLREVRDKAAAILNGPVHVTGSGAALFAVAESPEQAQLWASRIEAEMGVPAVATATLNEAVL